MAANKYIKLFAIGQLLFIFTAFVASLHVSKMKVTGKITVSGLEEGVSLAEESYLTVKLEDTGLMDVSSVLVGKEEQTLVVGTKLGPGSEALNYTIVCEKPEHLGLIYSVSAVLNVGWKATGDEWIRKGDYMTDTMHNVDLSEEPIEADIEMVPYPKN